MTVAIEVQHLTKVYDNHHTALQDVSFQVKEGDFFALLGPNGAGKSTIIGILTSLVRKTTGRVSVCGYDLDQQPYHAKTLLGVVPQEINLNPFNKVWQIVVDQAGFYGIPYRIAKKKTEKLLEQLGLRERLQTEVRQLSGGMKRRLMLARALVHEPKILILDEPTAGVDIELRRSLWHFLEAQNQQGLTIVLTTHYLEEAEQLCRQVSILNKGQMIRHMPMTELLKELEGESFILYPHQPITLLPELDHCQLKLLDNGSIEAEIPKGYSVTALLKQLDQAGVEIDTLRNKANRLEELFVHLTGVQA